LNSLKLNFFEPRHFFFKIIFFFFFFFFLFFKYFFPKYQNNKRKQKKKTMASLVNAFMNLVYSGEPSVEETLKNNASSSSPASSCSPVKTRVERKVFPNLSYPDEEDEEEKELKKQCDKELRQFAQTYVYPKRSGDELYVDLHPKDPSPLPAVGEWVNTMFDDFRTHHFECTTRMEDLGIQLPVLDPARLPNKMWVLPPKAGTEEYRSLDLNAESGYNRNCSHMYSIYSPKFISHLSGMIDFRDCINDLPHMEHLELGQGGILESIIPGVYIGNASNGVALVKAFPELKIKASFSLGLDPRTSFYSEEWIPKCEEVNFFVFNDACPMVGAAHFDELITRGEFTALMELLIKAARTIVTADPTKEIIYIHCMQGKSRTYLFCFMLLFLLARTGHLYLEDEDPLNMSSAELSSYLLAYLKHCRPFLELAHKWHTFVDYFFTAEKPFIQF
jgi:hypothetical protein